MKSQNRFPDGWDDERVQRVLEHCTRQSEMEAVAEDEAAYENQTESVVEVPVELVPEVRALIAKYKRTA
ncbi:MAG: hypothetical protein IID41_00715 [Planctomycetes bacterium]|nr:hypothetical protein [Planctomycetota bacterium]